VLWDRISADQWQRYSAFRHRLAFVYELGQPPFDYDLVLDQAALGYRDAVVVLMTPATFPDRGRLTEAAVRHRMASVFGLRAYTEAGGLFSYGANIDGLYRRAADFVNRIAKGAKTFRSPPAIHRRSRSHRPCGP
jgi:putative tryptophan/tyrosine transport system substrate-binding protein